ncbi:gamma-glutamyltranspeptidase / glutathione hydrolase [Enhydrobacter aerosaccus]|uniref:Gamma-glutamyltranspeptidase / glutathione hydrolase n=1 Tax=Enhydrobacter aerosaccus TaxID=225324 RepID=A0A1T4P5H0_9HYPH|nr:gamma-glutamyltransferase [Enhydrobacter aerosaccus]SJZ86577.1 gamma-glutamyltranspeptidase / glutathione hydrolase [Enhydrobacter aerosaccus]
MYQHGKRPTIASRHGMVAAAHPLAAAAGARVLGNGGTAFDAAVATAATLNVVEPYMSGLAGRGVATCYIAKERRIRCLDFVAPIPLNFPVDKLSRRDQLMRGALPVGAPGNLAGWCELIQSHGRKKLPELFAPAIAIARDGFRLIEFNIEEIRAAGPDLANHQALYPEWSRVYTGGQGTVSPGFILKQPDLARTLEALAQEGPGLLYGGALGQKIIDRLSELGGCLTMDDFKAVKPNWVDPATADYRGYTVNVPPPPCEGFQYLLTLRILEGFDLAGTKRNSTEHFDTVLRAIRLAAGVRIATGVPSRQKLAEILSDSFVEPLRARVRDGQPIVGPTEQWTPMEGQAAAQEESHTTSFSIADSDGNLICVTQSLGSVFGSAVVVPGTGLCLNNFLYWADVNPDSPNRVKPGGALPMCMAPSVVTKDDRPVLALGTPGSYGILQTQPQALVQYLDFGLPLQQAIESPRARLTDGREVLLEARLEMEVHEALRQRGHSVTSGPAWTMKVGGMQGVAVDPETGIFTGGCDPRRDGYCVPA